MSKLNPMRVVGLALLVGLVGCAADYGSTDAVPADEIGKEAGVTPTAFEFGNGLLPACFWSTGAQKTLRALANGPLADAGGTMPQMMDILPTCYDVVKYAVQCALDNTQSVTNPHVSNSPYQGAVGLATHWRTQPLDSEGRKWVTACMIQRLNALGLTVPILLEGDHAPLYEDTSADAKYSYDESTGFGDLFSSSAPLTGLTPAFTAYVCTETELTNACINATNLLQLRICDNVGLLCGLKNIGKCSTECQANGPYWTCPKYGFSQTIRVQTQDKLCL